MFNPFKKDKKEKAEEVIKKFQIKGMHCTSCAMSIDGELEDIEGVSSATTQYASATTEVSFDPTKINGSAIQKAITGLGYTASEIIK